MNFITVSAKIVDQPKSLDSRIACTTCTIEIPKPKFGNSYVSVYAELKMWGKNANHELLLNAPIGQTLLINEGELVINYDKETKTNTVNIKAKNIAPYHETYPTVNVVVLGGRTTLDFDPTDPKQRNYRATASGWLFAEQRIGVQNRSLDKYPDVYTFKSVYDNNAQYRKENYPDAIANHLNKKNVPITIKGSLIREESKNPQTGDSRYYPKILLGDDNSLIVNASKENQSQSVKPIELKPQSTTKVITENPWKDPDPLPSLAPDPRPLSTINVEPNTDDQPF